MSDRDIYSWVRRVSNEYFQKNHFDYGSGYPVWANSHDPTEFLRVVIFDGDFPGHIVRVGIPKVMLEIRAGELNFSDTKKPVLEGNKPASDYLSMLEEKVREEGFLKMRLKKVVAASPRRKDDIRMHIIYEFEEDPLSNER